MKVIDSAYPEYNIDQAHSEITKNYEIDPDEGYELPAKQLVLAWTSEYVNIPIDSRLAARIEGKSSLRGSGWEYTSPRRRSTRGSTDKSDLNDQSRPRSD